MPAITSAQYEAIGRLAMATNDIDDYLDALLDHFLSTKIALVGRVCLGETRFVGDKHRLLRVIIRELANKFAAIQPFATPVNSTLDEVKALLDQRNRIIHGKVIIGPGKTVSIESPQAVAHATPEQITALATKAASLMDDLVGQCSDILEAVGLL